jgi:hypothetical protein
MLRSQRNGKMALLRLCHDFLHGAACKEEGCTGASRDQGAYFARMLTSTPVSEVWGTPRARACQVKVHFDFALGTVLAEGAERWCKAVRPRLSGVTAAGAPAAQSESPLTEPLAKARSSVAAKPVAAPAAAAEIVARLELQAGRVSLQLRVGGRQALNFGTAPPRQSALAAAASRARAEQELEEAVATAEADEAERRESWRLAQELAAERATKEEQARRLAVAEEAARAAQQLAAERLERQRACSASALEKAREGEGYWRGVAAEREQQLYEARRQPDAQVRSANASTMSCAKMGRGSRSCDINMLVRYHFMLWMHLI